MIYVTADIHGNIERYRSLMSKIGLKPDDTLYVLGDVIDRHPDSIKILLEIMDSDNIKMLLGNHEYMMLNALRPPANASGTTMSKTSDIGIITAVKSHTTHSSMRLWT